VNVSRRTELPVFGLDALAIRFEAYPKDEAIPSALRK
jgi:hypothetical protein